jgi:outer membrane protein assembly factor BamB
MRARAVAPGPSASRLLAVAVGLAVGFAVPLPARAAEHAAPRARWSVPLPNGPLAVVADEAGLVATTNLGDVVAIDPDGHREWRTEVGTQPAAPALAEESVVVGDEHAVRVLDRGTGVTRWRQAVAVPVHHVAAGAGVAVVVDLEGWLRALDIGTGALRWELPAARPFHHEPVVDAASATLLLVIRGADGNALRAIDVTTGTVRWERPVDAFTAVPLVADDRVYVAEGNGAWAAVVLSLDLRTGERAWTSQMPASFESGIVPAADDRFVFVVDHYGTVTALDRSSGHVRWQRPLDVTVLATRIVPTTRHAVLTTAEMEVVVLDRANGRVVRRVAVETMEGWAVDMRRAVFRRRGGVVAAVRLGERERIELWPVP